MASKFWNSTTFLVLGILIFLVGCIQPSRYEAAKESGYEVEATIVDVVKKEQMDDVAYDIYGDYSANGKEYRRVKLKTVYQADSYAPGQTIQVVVNPDDPGEMMFEGGVLCVIGFVMAVAALIFKSKKKKQRAAIAQEVQPEQADNPPEH